MLTSTVKLLSCPRCRAELRLHPRKQEGLEVVSGDLDCISCRAKFPILAGVGILVSHVEDYLAAHAKGISKVVPDSEIPKQYLRAYREAKAELQEEHIEEDLEAERVLALYLLNHYVRLDSEPANWWKPLHAEANPIIDGLVREHWDKGPFHVIEQWLQQDSGSVIELGCGVGGLYRRLKGRCERYLGIDSSFGSIALARHLNLGVPYPAELRVPNDLLQGAVSLELQLPCLQDREGGVDFVVGDLEALPVTTGSWDISISLNAIDMLEDPAVLPRAQHDLVKKGGSVIQSCPYIWHAMVARKLRKSLPREVHDSATAVETLYKRAGLKIERRAEHVPWLFFKHVRQLEIYSVHAFMATRSA